MTSVGSVDPWSAGDDSVPAALGENSAQADGSVSTAEDDQPRVEMLIGFLTDFHAAGREPPPEPAKAEPDPPGPIPSRFAAFAPPDQFGEAAEHLAPSAQLPVWPPPPAVSSSAVPGRGVESAQQKQSILGRLGRRR